MCVCVQLGNVFAGRDCVNHKRLAYAINIYVYMYVTIFFAYFLIPKMDRVSDPFMLYGYN